MKKGNLAGRIETKYRLRNAVKEALDTLPSAVCYFTPLGTVKLCNTAMYQLVQEITGRDLQSLDELHEALGTCSETTDIVRDGKVFLFPDGRAWQYSSEEVVTAEGDAYAEVVLSDVTALYQKRCELQQQSSELKEMYRQLKVLSANVLEMTREQEILNLKSRLHDQMNMGVAAIRQIARQDEGQSGGLKENLEENRAAIRQFRRAIQVLREETAYPQGDIAEFIKDAKVSGIRVEIVGDFPKESELLSVLLPVLREACVNAARHADASVLHVEATCADGSATLVITNDGRQPTCEVVPRGGLAYLGGVVAAAGGTLEIASQPAFSLTITLPMQVQ